MDYMLGLPEARVSAFAQAGAVFFVACETILRLKPIPGIPDVFALRISLIHFNVDFRTHCIGAALCGFSASAPNSPDRRC